jgi:outer membrane protein OmpA-like peptidoglycan-associated protein
MPLSDQFELMLSADYKDRSALLSKNEAVYVSGQNGLGRPGEFEHTVDASITTAGSSVLLNYRIGNTVRLGAGIRAAAIMSKSFEQQEEIVEPDFGVFTDTGTRLRNQYSGDIEDASAMELSAVVAVSADIPISGDYQWFVVPRASLEYNVMPISEELEWNTTSLALGAGIRYAPRKIVPPPAPPTNPPVPALPEPPAEPSLAVDVDAYFRATDNKLSSVSELKVEEFLRRKTTPLLNYVFFDKSESELPVRYKLLNSEEQTQKFSLEQLYGQNTVEIYHNVLNIIGRRLINHPRATVDIVGCNSDYGPEKGNTALSRQRAEVVRNYLVNIWDINADRISLSARNLPEVPSNPESKEGRAENRRVEITSNMNEILEPLTITDTMRVFDPPMFVFKPETKSNIGIKKWSLFAIYNGDTLKTFRGEGLPPEDIDWRLSKGFARKMKGGLTQPMDYRLAVEDNSGKQIQSPEKSIRVKNLTIRNKALERIGSKEIDKFSLILFPFNQSRLGNENRRIVESARKRIESNSTVKIYGYSDKIGNEEYNEKLSTSRAVQTAKALGLDSNAAEGLGESKLLFDNDLPEGRMYCRTVVIEIITPVE